MVCLVVDVVIKLYIMNMLLKYMVQHLVLKIYVKLQNWKPTLVQDERGQDLIEYALVVALIAFAAVAGMNAVASKINVAFANIGVKLNTYTS